MKKQTITAAAKEQEMGLYDGRLWKNWADFAKDHDMIIANWIPAYLYDGFGYFDSYNDYDEETGESWDIYQYFITDYSTIRDIEYFDIDITYFVIETKDNDELYVIGVTHFGTPWEGVDMYYFADDEDDEDEE